MTNKYLEKIAESDLRALSYMDKTELQSKARADGAQKAHTQGFFGGVGGGIAGHLVGKHYGHAGRGAVLGAAALGYMNYKNGLAEGHYESIQKSHATMKKAAGAITDEILDEAIAELHAEDKAAGRPYVDYAKQKLKKQANDHVKDIKDTATIGALGGVASIGAHKILESKGMVSRLARMSSKGKLGVVAGLGTGIGLAADYAGLKLNKATDKLLPQNNKKDTNVPL